MRIGLVVATVEPGGVTTVTRSLARGLVDAGHEVQVHVIKPLRALPDEVGAPYSVHHWGCRSVRVALPRMRRLFRSGDCDVIVTAQSYVNVMAAVARPLRSRTGLLVVEHSSVSGIATHGNRRDRLMPILMRLVFRRADAVAAVSEGAANDLRRALHAGPARVKVLPNPLLPDESSTGPTAAPEHPFFENADTPVIIAVGRLAPEKRYGDLVEAFAVARRDVDARLVIVGEGPERAQIEQRIAECGVEQDVWVPGYVDHPSPFFAAADVLALSSEFEGFGVVLIEALAAGCRVVATDCPHGPREILDHGRLGRLVPVGDPTALAEALVSSLAEPRPDPQAVEQALHPYRVGRAVERYVTVLEGVIAASGGSPS